MYSGFKEPNNLNFDENYIKSHTPKRIAKSNMQNYSKLVKEIKSDNDIKYVKLECDIIHFEQDYPISNIALKNIPKKE